MTFASFADALGDVLLDIKRTVETTRLSHGSVSNCVQRETDLKTVLPHPIERYTSIKKLVPVALLLH